MSNEGDVVLDPQAVRQLTLGLRGAVGELRELGAGNGALVGRGFSRLQLTGMEAGHKGVADDFERFCESWEWGVRALVQDANALADRVDLAAGKTWENENYVRTTLKTVGNAAAGGDPHLTEQEVAVTPVRDLLTPGFLDPDLGPSGSFRPPPEEGAPPAVGRD